MIRVFFTDRNLGNQFPQILRDGGLQVEQHTDLFAPDGDDEDWLAYCGQNRRVAITHDQRIRYRANERNAVLRNNVAMLIVVGKARFAELAENFVATLPKIEAFLDTHKPPFIAKVYRASPSARIPNPEAQGNILLWYPLTS